MPFFDDLSSLAVSRLVAEKKITRDMSRVWVHFAGSSAEFAVSRIDFPNGGWWAFVICQCGKRVRSLWLHDGLIRCRHCLRRLGFSWRCEHRDKGPRLDRLRARLGSPDPARLRPRPARTLDRRWRLEAALRRALLVERLGGLRAIRCVLDGGGEGG